MKRFALLGLLLSVGCAEVAPTISAGQIQSFQAAVVRAKLAGAEGRYSPAATKLRDAQSDFYYAQHLPGDPARARQMAAQAQQEADTAVTLAGGDAQAQVALSPQ